MAKLGQLDTLGGKFKLLRVTSVLEGNSNSLQYVDKSRIDKVQGPEEVVGYALLGGLE